MLVKARRSIALLLAFLMIVTSVQFMSLASSYADAVDDVLSSIGELSNDPRDFTAADTERVEAIQAAYEALSAEDQATVDSTFEHPSGDGQSYGRILEAALWAVRSYGIDTGTTLAPGTYTTQTTPAISSVSNKGKSDSSRTRNWWVESVKVEDGHATAYIYVTGGAATANKITSYPSVWVGGQTIERDSDDNFPIPVDLNGTTYFGGVSGSMPRPIMYTLSTTIEEPAPEDPTQDIELAITNNTGMFKAETASLHTEDGKTYLIMALSGTGYRELFKGTYEQAVANGDGSADAGNDSWIHGYENAAGKLEFRIPVEDGETYMPLVAVSNSYYQKYLNGQNTLARAFYPRQAAVDAEAKTLVTGDYEYSQDLEVTNNVSMLKVTSAKLDTVGGPNSNNYKADLVLKMGSTAYGKAFVGTYAEAGEAEQAITLDEDSQFTIPVKWVETFGQPETMKTLADGEPFYLSLWSVNKETWYERIATLDEAAGTLVLDPSNADYTAVDAAIAAIPGDLSIYTEESAAAVTAAQEAVVRGKFKSQQAEVDAMAKAINDAVAALEEKPDDPTPSDTTIEKVRKAIQGLSVDPTSYSSSDRSGVEKIWADFKALSSADQATLDAETSHSGTSQPLGRVLETALWAVWSFSTVDDSTTLPDGTYDAASTPALSSVYSKGKSTSERQRPWSVKSVTVSGGKATAVITVESETYSGIWIGGKTYPKTNTSGNAEFAGVPIDLNSTFYFAGISTSMPTPIAFSLTTTIEEPSAEHTHSLTKVESKKATCTEDGAEEYWLCSGCGKKFSDAEAKTEIEKPASIPALGHDFKDVKESVEPGFGTDGYILYECSHKCGGTKKEGIPSLKAQAEDAIKAADDAATAAKTPEELAEVKKLAEEADKKVAAAEKAAGAADQTQLEELKKANSALQQKVAETESAIAREINEAAEKAEKKAAGYTKAKYMASSVKAVQTALKALKEAKAGKDLAKIQAATEDLNAAFEAAVQKKATKIKVLKKSNKKTIKAKGRKLKKRKTFKVKTKASSGVKTTYKKIGKGNKKITINKKGKVTLKKGLKKGTYKIKVRVSAKMTAEYKAATKVITVRIKIKK